MKRVLTLTIAAVLTVGPLAIVASAGHEWSKKSGNSWSADTDGKRQH